MKRIIKNKGARTGIFFGATSGVITTIGLIVGLHALHAVIALGLLGVTWVRLQRGWLASSQLATAEVFWYFVVGVWPILYLTGYL